MLETIKGIRKKAKKHRELLENNETVTRYALVDPLLIALDWDVADPSVVVAEHTNFVPKSGRKEAEHDRKAHSKILGSKAFKNRVDYLLGETMVLEVKALNADLIPFVEKARDAALTRGVPYAGLTDGLSWRVYKVNASRNSSRDRPFLQFRLTESKDADLIRKITQLRRDVVENS